MKIKDGKGAVDDLESLRALLEQTGLTAKTRAAIEQEIRTIRAGERGEREAAYEIDFHHGPSRNWAVIHDLRIEHEGRVAQIDHLLIGRFLDLWVCETKHFSQGVAINEQGEFTRFSNGRPEAIPSPLEQNRKHLLVLDRILGSDKIRLPTRLGMRLKPRLHSVIVVSKNARITRPKANIDGIDCIVKSDQLRTLIERSIDDESPMSSLMTIGKMLSSEALEDFARQVARLHRPLRRDWKARFGLSEAEVLLEATTPAASAPSFSTTEAKPIDLQSASTEPETPKLELLSTSKLGAAMGLPNAAATLERLRAAGYLEQVDGTDRLTDKGKEAGGRFVEKSRFGPYFAWPRGLTC